MSEISVTALQRYLSQLFGGEVAITGIRSLGVTGRRLEDVLKGYGYGTLLRIDLNVEGAQRSVVFNTVKPGGFGHQRMADRAATSTTWPGPSLKM